MVVGLDDAGREAKDMVVVTAFPPVRLKGEDGLKEQLTLGSCSWKGYGLQESVTESEMLLTGVNVIWTVPVCPAVRVTLEELLPILKSGRFTVTDVKATADA